MKVQLKKVKAAGFSLVELLVVIAVIGIMAAIAIPMISNINQNATTAKNKRNAQQIASVYGAAIAAGANDFDAAATIGAVVDILRTGVQGAAPFENSTFKLDLDVTQVTTDTTGLLSFTAGDPPIVTYSGN